MGKGRDLKRWVVIWMFLVGMWGGCAAGDVMYVDDDADPGGNGQRWDWIPEMEDYLLEILR